MSHVWFITSSDFQPPRGEMGRSVTESDRLLRQRVQSLQCYSCNFLVSTSWLLVNCDHKVFFLLFWQRSACIITCDVKITDWEGKHLSHFKNHYLQYTLSGPPEKLSTLYSTLRIDLCWKMYSFCVNAEKRQEPNTDVKPQSGAENEMRQKKWAGIRLMTLLALNHWPTLRHLMLVHILTHSVSFPGRAIIKVWRMCQYHQISTQHASLKAEHDTVQMYFQRIHGKVNPSLWSRCC